MRSLAAVRLLAGILGIAAALVTSAPAQADPDCPNGQIISQDCDNCGPVQTQCVPPRPVLPQPAGVPVEVQGGIGIGNGPFGIGSQNGPFSIGIGNGPSF